MIFDKLLKKENADVVGTENESVSVPIDKFKKKSKYSHEHDPLLTKYIIYWNFSNNGVRWYKFLKRTL